MAAVVQQQQEATIEARQWPDRQNDREHDEGAGAESANAKIDGSRRILWRINPINHGQISADVERNACKQDSVIAELRAVPLHGAERGTHGLSSAATGGACTSRGGRSAIAIAKANATAKARTGQSAR